MADKKRSPGTEALPTIEIDIEALRAKDPIRPVEVQLYEIYERLEKAGDYAAAAEVLDAAITFNPLVAAFHNSLAVILAARLHEVELALQVAQRAIDLEPDNPHYINNQRKMLERLSDQRLPWDVNPTA